jgi:hypothetical protein
VSTYVISDRMADVILRQIVPVLDLRDQERGGGLFVVGNFGTGKSHLMSLVSGVAEHAQLGAKLSHPAVQEGMQPLLGRFCVIRQEFGATQMPLRDVVLEYLRQGIGETGHCPSIPHNGRSTQHQRSAACHDGRFSRQAS